MCWNFLQDTFERCQSEWIIEIRSRTIASNHFLRPGFTCNQVHKAMPAAQLSLFHDAAESKKNPSILLCYIFPPAPNQQLSSKLSCSWSAAIYARLFPFFLRERERHEKNIRSRIGACYCRRGDILLEGSRRHGPARSSVVLFSLSRHWSQLAGDWCNSAERDRR